MTRLLNCIMLIDDDHATNVYHGLVIKEGGYAKTIIVKQDAEAALAYLQSEYSEERPQPDLIFLDINMPRMNGWEFLEQYENLPPQQQAGHVIVMLSTSANPDDLRRAQQNRFVSEYHDKPLSEARLDAIIARAWPGETA